MDMSLPSNRHETVAALRRQLLEGARLSRPRFSGAMDGVFPEAFRRGVLVEYLADGGSSAATLALVAARDACREGQSLVVIDRERRFYPPAAAPWGIGPETIFVHPRTRKDELWALHQALSCQGVGAVLCWLEAVDGKAFRGLQLAAEQGGAIGLLVRPTTVRGRPTWSEMQLLATALPGEQRRRLRVEIVRTRGGDRGASTVVELDDETGTLRATRAVPLAPQLASATGGVDSPRAAPARTGSV